MDKKLYKKLEQRREKGTLRSLSSFEGLIDFASNDYLGLAKLETSSEKKIAHGATGSRLISGNSKFIESVEQQLSLFFQAESGLCFNSGYDANLGVFGSIPQRGDVVLYDEFIHASARDGIRLSNAKAFGFKHNDVSDLTRLLEKNKEQTKYIAVESLYSMHGDFCPLLEIIHLAKKYKAYIILDEAHTAGVFGFNGKGFAHALGLHNDCLIRLITFGKAYGAHGSLVLCAKEMQEYLLNFARSFIYTTALPSAAFQRMKSMIEVEEAVAFEKRLQLIENIQYFRKKLEGYELISGENSPIQFVRIGNLEQTYRIVEAAREMNIFIKAIVPPTVPEGDEGVRVSLHSFNSKKEIDALIDSMSV